ncbi:MAG TPA: glycosyltransferase family 1 protein [Vicinamibacteria bacterium]
MRIGVDARELQGRPTGVGRYLRNLLAAWPAGDAFVLYFNGAPPAGLGVEGEARAVGPAAHGLLWQERDLPRAARGDGLDVFFAPAYSCPVRLEVPRVTTVHDLSFVSLPEDFTLRDALRRRLTVGASVRVSRRIVVPSAFTAREVAARYPESAGRVRVIPEAAAADIPAVPPPAAGRGGGGFRFLTVGAILSRRRLPDLLRALAGLRPRLPGATLDVVGENRTHPRLDLPALARRLDLEDAVRFHGFVPDAELAHLYARADAFVYLSDYEGFGLPVLEALARGIPTVTSARPCLGELFGEAALLVEPTDHRALLEALVAAAADPRCRAQLSARGPALSARFTWVAAATRTRAVLAEAAA